MLAFSHTSFPQFTERTHNQALVQYQQFDLRVLRISKYDDKWTSCKF